MNSTGAIETMFRGRFERVGLRLPSDSIEQRRGGHLFQRGWHIGYQWGEENGEVYLDVLAQHCHPADHAERLWASGRRDPIETAETMYMVSAGATDAERQRIGRQHAGRTTRIAADLRQRGLLPPTGDNLPSLEINEHLRSRRGVQGECED